MLNSASYNHTEIKKQYSILHLNKSMRPFLYIQLYHLYLKFLKSFQDVFVFLMKLFLLHTNTILSILLPTNHKPAVTNSDAVCIQLTLSLLQNTLVRSKTMNERFHFCAHSNNDHGCIKTTGRC